MRSVARLLLILAAAATGVVAAATRPQAAAIDPARLSRHIRILASDASGSGWELAEQRAPNTRDPQVGTRFHQPADEWSPDLDFAAAARDVALYYRVGLRLAYSRDWPGWRPGTEFAALRARSAAQRH